jgi:hypothetical protein
MGKGKILQGDQLLEINGQNVRESNQKDVANQLNQLDGELVLLLGDYKYIFFEIKKVYYYCN